MPVAPTYPGVYIEEIPSGVHTIVGVATSITAFLGRASRGEENNPITITSFADYERSFGGLAADSSMSFAVRDFFLNGGSQAVIVRLFHSRFKTGERAQAKSAAEAVAQKAASATTAAQAQADVKTAADNIGKENPPVPVRINAANLVANAVKNRGPVSASDIPEAVRRKTDAYFQAHKDLALDLVKAIRDAVNQLITAAGNVVTTGVDVTKDIDAVKQAVQDRVTKLKSTSSTDVGSALDTIANFDNSQMDLLVLQWAAADAVKKAIPDTHAHIKWDGDRLNLTAAGAGTWGGALRVRVDQKVRPLLPGETSGSLFNLTVTDGVTVEKHQNLSAVVVLPARRTRFWLRSPS